MMIPPRKRKRTKQSRKWCSGWRKEFKDFALENVVGDMIVATAVIPTKAKTAAATVTAIVTISVMVTTVSDDATTAAVAAATSIGATTRGAVTAAADPTRASKAELIPKRHKR